MAGNTNYLVLGEWLTAYARSAYAVGLAWA